MPTYNIENKWGTDESPWHNGGVFVIGCRDSKPQNVVAVEVTSTDGGQTLVGTMTYAGEGPIGFRGTLAGNNNYVVENQWGGDSAPWHPGGTFVLGFREGQAVVSLSMKSTDGGKTFTGAMTYAGEGPIELRATEAGTNMAFETQNQWGGASAPWHTGGIFVLGGRQTQPLYSIDVRSNDGGNTLEGAITYAGEGPIGFRARLIGASNYVVENQWGGESAPWHPGGTWLIGYRAGNQLVQALSATPSGDGYSMSGTMTYAGEGPIGFKGSPLSMPKLEQPAS